MRLRKPSIVLLAFLALQAAAAGAQTLFTIAGSGDVMVDTGDGTAATTTYLHLPKGVVSDGAGSVYITDESGFTRIRKVNLGTGIISTYAGGGGIATVVEGEPAAGAFLSYPEKIALDGAGNLYIADTKAHRIRKVLAATGQLFTVAGNGTAGFSGDGGPATAAAINEPTGVAVDSLGNVYFSDRQNGRIRKVDAATGNISTVAGTGFQGFSGDNGPAANAQLNFPNGVAVDAARNLYVADTNNDRVRRIDAASGLIYTIAGTGVPGFSGDGGLATSARLSLPWDVAVDAAGNVLVADRNNMRIRRILAGAGTIATVAGNGNPFFNGDNLPALGTAVYSPFGVGVDATGAIFVADTNNNRVRSFVPVGATPQSINFPVFAVRTYLAGEAFALNAAASSGLPVAFSSLTPSVCTVAGAMLTLVADGTCTVAADQGGDATYAAAARVTRGLIVGLPVSGPAAFAFVDQTDAPPGRTLTSNAVTVTGIPTLAISVTGGSYSVGCTGIFTSAPGTIADGQSVCVRHVSSFSPGTATDTTLSIGTTSDTFTSTTAASNSAGIIIGYYLAILRRGADPGGLAYWDGEAARMVAQGADVNETWRAMAMAFFGSAEYASLGRTDDEYVVDLYNAFFSRPPDAEGLAYWTGQIASGIPRQVVLLSFLFSGEFSGYTQALFGTMATRPEKSVVVDFYRGFLARLPDSPGLQYWSGRFLAAMCASPGAVVAEADAISQAFLGSAEYAARGRTNQEFVADLYNGFMRRGADLAGVQFWQGQLDSSALTREQLRLVFLGSGEFQARVNAMVARGCT